ncbi:MAG: hypothetical protein WBA76_19175 [Phormidesmis sp.]
MSVKQKVTLYIPDDLHRQFKIRSAVDGETMSSIAQRAIEFYLCHADQVESFGEAQGQTHRIHSCPQCDASVALRDDSLTLIQSSASVGSEEKSEELVGLERIVELNSDACISDEGKLITC